VANLRLEVSDGALVVIIADDGRGIAPDARDGTGLRSMRERAGELGGRCDVEGDPHGTTVTATLPVQGPT
jgi:signal transduction histidine kinase